MLVELYGRQIDIGPNPSKVCRRRWLGQMSPEPETVAWIESLPAGATFYDIGANVGTFSVRACLRGLNVTAFEPHSDTFQELIGICHRNQLDIFCVNDALSREAGAGVLARGRSTITLYKEGRGAPIKVNTLDRFIDLFKPPQHIKLDVDGNEPEIIEGGRKCIGEHVQSMLIEIDPGLPSHNKIVSMMSDLGFTYDLAQVEACMVKGGKYDGMANWIFTRQA